ncbi:MAG: hypothetical protein MJ107_00195 [Lachnospiraceae bacterium]|nr:hypothetical protein [Lachnospiraceae bacterium]
MNILLALYYQTVGVASNLVLEASSMGFNPVKKIIIALVVGLIVGLLYALSLKGQLTSVYKKETAADYTRPNSFKLTGKRDLFLYTKTEKTPKPQQSQAAPAPQAPNNRK